MPPRREPEAGGTSALDGNALEEVIRLLNLASAVVSGDRFLTYLIAMARIEAANRLAGTDDEQPKPDDRIRQLASDVSRTLQSMN